MPKVFIFDVDEHLMKVYLTAKVTDSGMSVSAEEMLLSHSEAGHLKEPGMMERDDGSVATVHSVVAINRHAWIKRFQQIKEINEIAREKTGKEAILISFMTNGTYTHIEVLSVVQQLFFEDDELKKEFIKMLDEPEEQQLSFFNRSQIPRVEKTSPYAGKNQKAWESCYREDAPDKATLARQKYDSTWNPYFNGELRLEDVALLDNDGYNTDLANIAGLTGIHLPTTEEHRCEDQTATKGVVDYFDKVDELIQDEYDLVNQTNSAYTM